MEKILPEKDIVPQKIIAKKRQRYEATIKVSIDYTIIEGARILLGVHIETTPDVFYTYSSHRAFDRNHVLHFLENHPNKANFPLWYTTLAETANLDQFWSKYDEYYAGVSTLIDINFVADLFYDYQVILYTASNTESVFTHYFPETVYVAHRLNTVDLGDGIGVLRDTNNVRSVSVNNINQIIVAIGIRLQRLLTNYSTYDVKSTAAWKELKTKFFR